ncbi:MAG: hypothetical protein AAF628_02170 [Planctomycetota bacterium]
MGRERAWAACLLGGLVLGGPQDGVPPTRLDATGAFFYPGLAAAPTAPRAALRGGAIEAGTYLRYLAARVGDRYLEDLAFDLALTRECAARGLARTAPVLARSAAAQRLAASGRSAADDPNGALRRKFATEALRDLRVDALVRADRPVTDAEVRALFARRFGPDGRKHGKVTKFEQVAPTLRRELRHGPAAPPEVRALRRTLLAKYEFKRTP